MKKQLLFVALAVTAVSLASCDSSVSKEEAKTYLENAVQKTTAEPNRIVTIDARFSGSVSMIYTLDVTAGSQYAYTEITADGSTQRLLLTSTTTDSVVTYYGATKIDNDDAIVTTDLTAESFAEFFNKLYEALSEQLYIAPMVLSEFDAFEGTFSKSGGNLVLEDEGTITIDPYGWVVNVNVTDDGSTQVCDTVYNSTITRKATL